METALVYADGVPVHSSVYIGYDGGGSAPFRRRAAWWWGLAAVLGLLGLLLLGGGSATAQELGKYLYSHGYYQTEWKVPSPTGWASAYGILDPSATCALEQPACYNQRYGPAPKDPWHRGGDQVGERFSREALETFFTVMKLPGTPTDLDVSDAKLVKGAYDQLILPAAQAGGGSGSGSSGAACPAPKVCSDPVPCPGVVCPPVPKCPDCPLPPPPPLCPTCPTCPTCPALVPLSAETLQTLRDAMGWAVIGSGRKARLGRALRELEKVQGVEVRP